MTVIWVWLVGLTTKILKKFQGRAQIKAFLNIPKGCIAYVIKAPFKGIPCLNAFPGRVKKWYVKKCRNFGQTLEFLKDFCYKPNQPDPNNNQIIAFSESGFLNNKFLNTPKGCTRNYYYYYDYHKE